MRKRNSASQVKSVITDITKWAIIVVAGQSNAVGYDESPVDASEFQSNPRIKQLGYHTNNLEIIDLGFCAQNFQDMRGVQGGTKGIHYHLARRCLDFLPPDVGVLIIPAAFGGTSACKVGSSLFNSSKGHFDSNTKKITTNAANNHAWGAAKDGSDYTDPIRVIIERVKYVNSKFDSALLGIVFCQGEHTTVGSSTGINTTADVCTVYTELVEGIIAASIRNGIKMFDGRNVSRRDIYIYESTYYWSSSSNPNQITYNTLSQYYQKMLPGNNYYIPPKHSGVTNETNGTGITSSNRPTHFGNNAFRDYIAPAMAMAIQKSFTLHRSV